MQYTVSTGPSALGYVRVADGEGPIFRKQAEVIEDGCMARRMVLLDVVFDIGSYDRPLRRRPGLMSALDRLADGEAGCLVVGRLDHLTRSTAELRVILTGLIERSASLVVLEAGGRPAPGNRFGRGEPHEHRLAALAGRGLDVQAIVAALGSDG